MKTLLLNTLRKLRPSHLLTAFFLCYIFYVALAPFPGFLHQLGKTVYWKSGYNHFIETVDQQYADLLTTESASPLLQNKGTYINLNGAMAKLMQQPLMNKRVLLKNGHLSHVVSEQPHISDIRDAAENIIHFHDTHTASGGKFLFVMAPSQISKYEELLPAGYTDTTNDTADVFLAMLEQAGVPYLDLRAEMEADGMSVTESFFTTDHHWTPQTAFWAYGKILNRLAQLDAIGPVDPFYTDPQNFTFETYENTFLGSSGKRTGPYYAGLDDSIFIRPNFETNISILVPERQLELQGPYEEISYNTEAVHNFRDPDFYQENCYGLYGWGDTQITHWRNENAPQQGKFLLIGESFGNIPFSLMSIYCESCDEVDMRHFQEDFAQYYETYAPDTVIVEVNVDMTLSENTQVHYLK